MRGYKIAPIISNSMIKKTGWFLFLAVGLFFLGGVFSVMATTTCEENMTLSHGVCIPNNTGLPRATVASLLVNLLRWLLYIFGTVAVIAFVVSGIMYVTSAGNDKQIDTAKEYMTWSIVGIIVAFSGVILITAISSFLAGTSTVF